MLIRLPIIIVDDTLAARIFTTEAEAGLAFEPQDWEGGYIHAWDASGQKLFVVFNGWKTLFVQSGDSQPDQLLLALTTYRDEHTSQGYPVPDAVLQIIHNLNAGS
jgi:hypothetical protein